jgi:hypothetical protein
MLNRSDSLSKAYLTKDLASGYLLDVLVLIHHQALATFL